MTDPVSLQQAAARLLGPCELITVLAGKVIRVETASGEEFVVKQHLNRTLHEREVHAYRHWTTALGPFAPVLIAVDDAAMIIATSALPGSSPNPSDLTPELSRQAGVLLRRFHEAEPPTAMPGYRSWLRERTAHWVSRAEPLLTPDDRAIIRDHLAAVGQPDIPSGGPCHPDFQPRNWLTGSPGDVSVIDFEHARIDLPARDLVRLRFRTWPVRPEDECRGSRSPRPNPPCRPCYCPAPEAPVSLAYARAFPADRRPAASCSPINAIPLAS